MQPIAKARGRKHDGGQAPKGRKKTTLSGPYPSVIVKGCVLGRMSYGMPAFGARARGQYQRRLRHLAEVETVEHVAGIAVASGEWRKMVAPLDKLQQG